MQQSVSGKFVFQLTGASLTRDVKLIGSMNPYVTLRLGDVKKTSAVNEKGGKTPKWCDKIEFHRVKENQLLIEVFNMRKLGLFDNDLIAQGTLDLCKYVQPYSNDETIPLFYTNQAAGQLFMKVTFTPDVQITYQQGYLVQQGEIPIDMTVRIVSALLTRDTQWFGSMKCFYIVRCGDKKHTSTVCDKGKTPQWADKFQITKKSDQKFTIEVQNQNNNTNIAYCQVPHEIFSNYQPGVRTLPLTFQGTPAGQIFIEVVYNTYPQDIIIPIYQPVPEQYCPPQCVDPCQQYPPMYPPQQQYPQEQSKQYPPQQQQYPPQPQQQYPPQPQNYNPPQYPSYEQPQYPPQQQPQYPPQQQPQYPPQPENNQPNPYGHYPNLQQQYPPQNNYNGVYSPPPAFG